ncbi:MAG: TolC family protein, partial [bacterium]
MRIVIVALLAAPCWALAMPAAASEVETPPVLTLEEATARALDASPGLRAAGAGVEAAEGSAWQARVRPNPELGFEAENILGSGELSGFEGGEYTLGIGQRIELGGKRRARIAVAEGAQESAIRARQAARLASCPWPSMWAP